MLYYVMLNGNDDNDGLSVETGFETIGKARDVSVDGDWIVQQMYVSMPYCTCLKCDACLGCNNCSTRQLDN